MSARVTALVWAKYPQGAGEMLLALALADQSTDAGEHIAIDIPRFAKKTRQAADTVRTQLRRMAESGWLERMEGAARTWRISPAWLGSPAVDTPVRESRIPEAKATRLSREWLLPAEWKEWALQEFPAWTSEVVDGIAAAFRDHWTSAGGQNARKVDWSGTWRNWCRKEPAVPKGATLPGNGDGGEWWKSAKAIEEYGAKMTPPVVLREGEMFPMFRDRVYRAAGDGPWMALLYRGQATTQGFKSAAQVAGLQPGD